MDMNVVEILSQIIEEEFNTTKQNEIAKILDIQPGQLSTYLKNNSAGKNVIKKMLFAFAEEYAQRQLYTKANPTKTIVEVVETSFKTQNQGESAKILGINQGQLSSYINKNNAGNNAIKNMLNDLVGHIRKNSLQKVITPIIELKKIKPEKYNAKYLILANEHKKDVLKDSLEGKVGVYLFYNSQGKNIYIGKTEKDLYFEICQQFSRNIEFFAEGVKKEKHPQGEIACYLSAYEISPKELIKNIEALLIRSYANDNTNIKMENFKP
jgi:predicted transcriptional regulator